MQQEQLLRFGQLTVDFANQRLWRGKRESHLTPKAFRVLQQLLAEPGRLVTKEELFTAVWPDTVVEDAALTVVVGELRKALRDSASKPRYIETVRGQGYRFIAPLIPASPVSGSKLQVPSSDTQHSALSTQHSVLVGREPELSQLQSWLAKALEGQRQIVFVTGEAGIGKTTLMEAFRQGLETRDWGLGLSSQAPSLKPQAPGMRVGWGQCIEQYGEGDAYLPILAALSRLCRASNGQRFIARLSQYAPTWMVQIPTLLTPPQLKTLQRKASGATRERMARELAEALEALAAEQPLLLILEDLHWSDTSTLELLAMLARRREPARLLLLCAYRPLEILSNGHPLHSVTRELFAHHLSSELALQPLSEADVAAYLHARFPVSAFPAQLAGVLFQRSGGNPLFLVGLVNDLIAQGKLFATDECWVLQENVEAVASAVPRSIRLLVDQQRERLTLSEQQVLAAASIAGMEFSTAAVAAALDDDVVTIETHCASLVERQQFLQSVGIAEWPDGTVAERYGFIHALYQHLWHERVSLNQQQRWHLRIGERKEQAYGKQSGEIAVELAVHFEQGRDFRRALQYLRKAAENALRRGAPQDAITLLTKELDLLRSLPEASERDTREVTLQTTLGQALMTIKGYTASDVEHAYNRARALAFQLDADPQVIQVLGGLFTVHMNHGEVHNAYDIAEQLLKRAEAVQTPEVLSGCHLAMGCVLYWRGEFAPAQRHLDQALAHYHPEHHHLELSSRSSHFGVDLRVYAAMNLCYLGYVDQALHRSRQAEELARSLDHPFSSAFAIGTSMVVHALRSDVEEVKVRADAVVALAEEHDFPWWLALGLIWQGWALVEQGQTDEGLAHMHRGLGIYEQLGTKMGLPGYLLLLAGACMKAGRFEESLRAVQQGIEATEKTGQRSSEASLLTLQAFLRLLTAKATPQEVETHILAAIDLTRRQEAKTLELLVTLPLARLWQSMGKKDAARHMLAEISDWFTEGFNTKTLQEAKALLEELK
jgi:DNA-binding winged helix-turn-helix (wHTH) protein/predicted ATPase